MPQRNVREKRKEVVIFEYDNYRTYLKDLYAYLKENKPHFSYRYFSSKAGFRSPNLLKLVIEGKRNLSPESIGKFIHALKLNKTEGEFFRTVVHLNQARTADEKRFYAEQLMRFRPFRYIHPIRKDQYEYYSQWYNLPIRELLSLPAFSEDPDWVAKILVPPISPQQARRALELLLALGLIRHDESGRVVQTDAFITTGDEVTSASVTLYHREMLRRASEAIDSFPPQQRDISSLTLALSEKNFKHIKQLIQKFRKELLAIANQDPSPEAVFQVNFQLFPLTRIIRKE
ncbi:MAG: TIGR02147 family protein [bacterium]